MRNLKTIFFLAFSVCALKFVTMANIQGDQRGMSSLNVSADTIPVTNPQKTLKTRTKVNTTNQKMRVNLMDSLKRKNT